MRLALAFTLTLTCTQAAHASRPLDALDADKSAAESEVKDLERRARALDEQANERRDRLKRRVRALYKLSSGGYLRLLVRADDPGELVARHEAVRRVLKRDLDELEAIREESRAVDADHARRSNALADSLERSHERAVAQSENARPAGLAARRGHLARPVPGALAAPFGVYKDADTKLPLSRRGLELSSHRGEPVRASAPGTVRWVGEVAGLGAGVMIDHGDGYLTLTARLREVSVEGGETVAAGAVLGASLGPTVYFELSQAGTPLDPATWLAR